MVVQHNLRAMNSNRMLGITSGILSKSAEKLSSGYKVNRAADDAAGLSISEKMRKQIRGLTQATANAEDGISSVQTAEGALTEVHDMLQRMNELANKASNGTNSLSDRQTIQDEVDQLLTEIDRVSETTKFNEIYLLKGDAKDTPMTKYVNAHDAGIKGTLNDKGGTTAEFTLKKALEDGDKINIAGKEYTIENKPADTTDPTEGLAKYAYKTGTPPTGIGATVLNVGDTIKYDVSKSSATSNGVGTTPQYRTIVMANEVDVAKAKTGTGALNKLFTTFTIEGDTAKKYIIGEDGSASDSNGTLDTINGEEMLIVTKAAAQGLVDAALTDGKKVTIDEVYKNTAGTAANVDTIAKMKAALANTTGAGEKGEMAEKGWTVVSALGTDENGAQKIGADEWTDATKNTLQSLLGDQYVNKADSTELSTTSKVGTTEASVAARIYSVKLGDKETTFTQQAPVSMEKVAAAVRKLQVGDQMYIKEKNPATANGLIIEIADKTDAKKFMYTVEDALKLINDEVGDEDEVAFYASDSNLTKNLGLTNGTRITDPTKLGANALSKLGAATAGSVIGQLPADETDAGVPGAAQKTYTADQVYKMIEDALTQASSIGADDDNRAFVASNGDGSFTITKGTATITDALSFNLHVGADADMTNKISVKIDTMDTKGLGIQNLDVIGRDATSGDKIDDGGIAATYAIDAISDAIAKVSAQRSLLGAVQNRLDHTINNLGNVVENTTAAESQIRDTDMATEMVKFSNTNILAQAGQSMLAQANQANQGVLSLLG